MPIHPPSGSKLHAETQPDTELASHYFQAVLPQQFDEYIWFDKTSAVSPFETLELTGLPDTYPFGL
jgi:protein-L-isoaspartate(D-aspartate) O-methyltransferase